MASLYDKIGAEKINQVITEFYDRAFRDAMIGYLFWSFSKEQLISQQIQFSYSLLGGPSAYRGRPLGSVHSKLGLRSGHFGRRQVIMAEVLRDLKVPEDLSSGWLEKEQKLRPVILSTSQSCQS